MARARLEVADARGQRTVPIDKDPFVIGRRSSHDLHLDGADVSRDHAQIEQKGDRFLLRDLGSRCGTFVNGDLISERVLLPGDRIHVGRTSGANLVFLTDQPPGLPSAAPAASPMARAGETVSPPAAAGDLRQVATLLDALRAVGSGRVLDEVLVLVLDSALAVTGAERGFIMLVDADGHLAFTLGRGRDHVTLPGRTFRTSRKIPEEVFATGEARVVADLLDGDLAGAHVGTIALGIRHVLCVPLGLVRYVEGPDSVEAPKRIGVLYLDGRDRGTLLSPTTHTALETLAGEAALVIENARLYRQAVENARLEQQMMIAADIQRALLPQPQHVGSGFELACASVPCLAIGGDFFDYVDLPDGGFGFVLGDVSGKGLPAALLTAVVQGVFSIEASLGHSPAQALAAVNGTLIRKAVEGRFATIFYGALSEGGRLTYTNAGHHSPIVLGTAGLRRLFSGGTIVGAFPDAQYEQDTTTLAPGDLVVVFSDGVTEAFSPEGEEFGDDRLIECVRANADRTPVALLDRIMEAVRRFMKDAVQNDDMTVVVLRYTGRPAATSS
jgi:serine phosphatase RsbU (regulator of sigma subunit)